MNSGQYTTNVSVAFINDQLRIHSESEFGEKQEQVKKRKTAGNSDLSAAWRSK